MVIAIQQIDEERVLRVVLLEDGVDSFIKKRRRDDSTGVSSSQADGDIEALLNYVNFGLDERVWHTRSFGHIFHGLNVDRL